MCRGSWGRAEKLNRQGEFPWIGDGLSGSIKSPQVAFWGTSTSQHVAIDPLTSHLHLSSLLLLAIEGLLFGCQYFCMDGRTHVPLQFGQHQ